MNEIKTDLPDDSLLTDKQAAAFLGCSRRQIPRYVERGLRKIAFGPRNVRYRVRDLKRFSLRFMELAKG